MATFSAALLAGGKSSRMGQDKALLPVPGYEFLWQRQLAVILQLEPERIFWSGPPRDGLPAHLILVEDVAPDAGPLGGICGCLEALESDLLLVLAIDLPGMTALYLRGLLARCDSIQGAVPRRESFREPLAAFYPKAMLGLAREHLATGKRALQDWVAAGAAAGLVRAVSVEEPDVVLFKNVNSPGDLA